MVVIDTVTCSRVLEVVLVVEVPVSAIIAAGPRAVVGHGLEVSVAMFGLSGLAHEAARLIIPVAAFGMRVQGSPFDATPAVVRVVGPRAATRQMPPS